MTNVLLRRTDERGVTTLTLHRPDRRNALDGALVAALLRELERLQDDATTRVVVVTGSGDTFCSGADLKWIQRVVAQGETANQEDARQLAKLLKLLNECRKPTLARVNGSAFGGGIGLMACCDAVVASDTAQFAFTEVRLGLVAAVILPYVLAKIGEHHARRYLLSAERFTCERAKSMGLVHEVVPAYAIDESVETVVSALLLGNQEAQRATKQLLKRVKPIDEETTLQTAELFALIRASPSGQAGIEAFKKRHKPPRNL